MSGKINETDKHVLKRIMSEPTFKAIKEAAKLAHEKRKRDMADWLKNASPDKTGGE